MRTAVEVIRWGDERARAGSWRGDARVAYLAPAPAARPPSTAFVERCLDQLAGHGFREVVTAALAPHEQAGFLGAGFTVAEELHLLAHDLVDLPTAPRHQVRRGRRRDRPAVLRVDQAAFAPFWQLDDHGLSEAIAATPKARFRVAGQGPSGPLSGRVARDIVGYAVTGRSADRGYLQRLAVDAAARGRGLGRALVLDGLEWLRRNGATRAVVNTQFGNDAALALYEAVGFRRQREGLSVLTAAIPA